MSDMKPASYTAEAYESMRRAYFDKCYELDNVEKELAHIKEYCTHLESQVVQMEIADNDITCEREFRISYSKLLDPTQAVDILVSNILRVLKGEMADNE